MSCRLNNSKRCGADGTKKEGAIPCLQIWKERGLFGKTQLESAPASQGRSDPLRLCRAKEGAVALLNVVGGESTILITHPGYASLLVL